MRGAAASLLLWALVTGCTASPSTSPFGTPPVQASGSRASEPPVGSIAPSAAPPATFVVPATGFAFDAESVVGFYRTRGYVCDEPRPSTEAAGYLLQTCALTDPDGRRLVIGVVTDPAGDLADGFATMDAEPGATFLDPSLALTPLGGFLGAMLAETRAAALLDWLATHLGDDYAETTAADLHIATYVAQPGDRRTLVVEVANDGYLLSPRPSPN